MNFKRELNEWFFNAKNDFLAGLLSAFAVIPEVIGFCIVAGISPMMGLYASFFLMVILSFLGGRPAMVSAAAGSMALVIVNLVRDYGTEYLMAAAILAGIFMIILGILKVGKLINYLPNNAMVGFVDALAILIFSAQLKHFVGEGPIMYLLVLIGLLIIYLLPKVFTALPSGLVAVIVVTAISMALGNPVRTIGDMGDIVASLPIFAIPDVPLNLETLKIILPYSISLALVGLVETLLTAQVVDEMTDSTSNKNRECRALGIANVVSALFGGTCGCGMIGQAIANVSAGGRGRLSTFVGGSFIMVLVFLLNDLLQQIPLAALVAVMFSVSVTTFDWDSLRRLPKMPKVDALVIILVVAVVVYTNNLAAGVVLGFIITAISAAVQMGKITVQSEESADTLTYHIAGEIFFASIGTLNNQLNYKTAANNVIFDFSRARVWDESAATALQKAVAHFNNNGIQVRFQGLDDSSKNMLTKLYGDKNFSIEG